MIELYVLLTLGAVGYMINKTANNVSVFQVSPKKSLTVNTSSLPSSKNVYDSNRFHDVKSIETKKAAKMFKDAGEPAKTGVIPRYKSLTGEYRRADEFTHNNMMPFFGSSIRQNLTDTANATLMESYTGNTPLVQKKCEAQTFFEPSKNVGNVFGAPNRQEEWRNRMNPGVMRNNEFPLEQVRVGPGVGLGYTSDAKGGFHQLEVQDIMMPKCVDELRVKNNPKITYEARTVDGLKSGLSSDKVVIGNMKKNRPETFYERTEDMNFKTTGAYLKPREIPDFDVKDTNRQDTTTSYIGGATRVEKGRRNMDSSVQEPMREQFREFNVGGVAPVNKIKGDKDDYGKSTILVYNNERQITGTRVYQGNVTSMIKSMVAPIVDAIKVTKKDGLVDNPRHFGNVQPQIPDKLTIYDPNDIARTTIKETLLHDNTMRGSVKGPIQVAVYDTEEIVAKTTVRETLKSMQYEMNLSAKVYKGTVHDPDDKARTTTKETTIDNEREGNLDALEGMGKGGYETNEYDARPTQKQYTSDYDYYGIAAIDKGEGYLTNEMEARATQKQFISDNDYYGGAISANKAAMSTVHMDNADISAAKESTLNRRGPVPQGNKTYTTADDMNVRIKKDAGPPLLDAPNRERIIPEIPSVKNIENTTRDKKYYGEDDRLDPSLLSAYMNNPYTIPINMGPKGSGAECAYLPNSAL